METEFINEELNEGRHTSRMSGAQTRRFHHLLRLRVSRHEAIKKSKDPFDLNKSSRSPLFGEAHQHSFQEQTHRDCNISYRELNDMSYMLPTTDLRNEFRYQTHVLGKDPDQLMKTMLADPLSKDLLDDDIPIGYERRLERRSFSVEATRPSTSNHHNSRCSLQTPEMASSRNLPEGGLLTEQCERRVNYFDSSGTGSFGYDPPRRDRISPGWESNRLDVRDPVTKHPSEYSAASFSQMAWKDVIPAERTDMDNPSYALHSRFEGSHYDSERVRQDLSDAYDPLRYRSRVFPEKDSPYKPVPLSRGRLHCDLDLDKEDSHDDYRLSRHDGLYGGSNQYEKDFRDECDHPRRDRSDEDWTDFCDRNDLARRDTSYHSPEFYLKGSRDTYDSRQRDGSGRGSEFGQRDNHGTYDSGARGRSGRCSSLKRADRNCPRKRDRSHPGSEVDRRDRGGDRYSPRRDKPHCHSERQSPSRKPKPVEDPSKSKSLKQDYEKFVRNLNWKPPHIGTTNMTSLGQPESSTTTKKVSTQFVPPSLAVVVGDPFPPLTPLFPLGPVKRPHLDQDSMNPEISSLMDPSNEAIPEEDPPWKQDYQRFITDQSWKLDFKRFMENINKVGTSSGQTSQNIRSQSDEVHRPEIEPCDFPCRKEHDQPSQSGTNESIEEPRSCEITSPKSYPDVESSDAANRKLGDEPTQPRTNESTEELGRQVKRMPLRSLMEIESSYTPDAKDRDEPTQPRSNESTEEPHSRHNQGRKTPPRSRKRQRGQDGMRRKSAEKTSPTGVGRHSAREQHPRSRYSKGLGSYRKCPGGTSSTRIASQRRSSPRKDDPRAPVFIVPTDYPETRLSNKQMDAIKSSILEAILDIVDESTKPTFKESFRRNGKFGVVCNDELSEKWLDKYIQMYKPWPNAALKIISGEATKVRVSVKLPLCKNDDDEKILKFIVKQNPGINAKDWVVFHRLDSDTSTSVMFLVDEDSVSDIRNRGRINFKMGRVGVVVEGDSEVETDLCGFIGGEVKTVPGLGGSDERSGPSSSRGVSLPQEARGNSWEGNGQDSGMDSGVVVGRFRPRRSEPISINETPKDLLDSRVARSSTGYSSVGAHSGRSDPVHLPRVERSYEEDLRNSKFGEQCVLSRYQPVETPTRDQRYYSKASRESQRIPSLLDLDQGMLEPPSVFLGDALATKSHRVSDAPSSNRFLLTRSPLPQSSHPHQSSSVRLRSLLDPDLLNPINQLRSTSRNYNHRTSHR